MAGNCIGRIRSMTCPLPEEPAHAPQTLGEKAQDIAGKTVGALQSAGEGLLGLASMASDSIVQLGNLATGGVLGGTDYVQGALGRQAARGQAMVDGVVQAATDPLGTLNSAVQGIEAQRQAAEQLRAAGQFFEAGKIEGALAEQLTPMTAGMTKLGKLDKLIPDEHPPRKRRGEVVVKQRRTKKVEPRCFGGDVAKNKPGPYDTQLQAQQDAINNMTVQEYLDNRARWEQMGRAGTAAEQVAARADAIKDMALKNTRDLQQTGMDPLQAKTQGMAQAQATAQHLDVLHSPDLSAGGSASGTSGLGDRSVNRSIGSNWGQNGMERVKAMDEVASKVPLAERAHTKMDVELKRCP